jgi:hypothetical protein
MDSAFKPQMLTAPSEPSGIPRPTQISRKAYQCLDRWPAWHPRFSSRAPSPLSDSHVYSTHKFDYACLRSSGPGARRYSRGGRRPLLRWPLSHTHVHTCCGFHFACTDARCGLAVPCYGWRRDAPIDYVSLCGAAGAARHGVVVLGACKFGADKARRCDCECMRKDRRAGPRAEKRYRWCWTCRLVTLSCFRWRRYSRRYGIWGFLHPGVVICHCLFAVKSISYILDYRTVDRWKVVSRKLKQVMGA